LYCCIKIMHNYKSIRNLEYLHNKKNSNALKIIN
jgi:hypothetical protein